MQLQKSIHLLECTYANAVIMRSHCKAERLGLLQERDHLRRKYNLLGDTTNSDKRWVVIELLPKQFNPITR